MAKIKLEKYVRDVVLCLHTNLQDATLLDYIDYVQTTQQYKNLTCRVVWDASKCYKWWERFDEADQNEKTDSCLYSLFRKAFAIAFPKAWEKLNKLEAK